MMARWWQKKKAEWRARVDENPTVVAVRMMQAGAADEEIGARLRALPGGQRGAASAAGVAAKSVDRGYPHTRLHRLLREAAGQPLPPLRAEEQELMNRQRQLREQPASVSFDQLAADEPALRDLERQAREDPESFVRDLSFGESGMIGKTLPRKQRDRQLVITRGIDKAVSVLLGPGSAAT